MNDQSLATRAIRGVFWTGSPIGLQLVISLAFFRYLPLEEMGQFHWALSVVMLFQIICALGLGEALVQAQDAGELHFSSAFWTGLVIGGGVSCALIPAAPFLAREDPETFRKVFVPLSLMVPFGAVSGVFRARLQRSLQFREVALSEVVSVVAAALASVGALWGGYGIWSPVANALTREIALLAGIWLASGWRPRFQFSWQALRALLPFGLHVTGANGVNFMSNRLDQLFIFYTLGERALGYYAFAFRFTMIPLTRAATVVFRVTFPTFSKVQEDDDVLRRGYLKAITGLAFLSWPALGGLLLFAPEVLMLVKGDEMMPVLDGFRLLTVAAMIKVVGTVVGPIFLAKGKAHWSFRWTLFNVAVMAPALYWGVGYGVTGVAFVVTLSVLLFWGLSQWLVNRLIGLGFGLYFNVLVRPAGITLVVMLVLWMIKPMLPLSPLSALLVGATVGVCVYGLALQFLAREFLKDFWAGLRGS
ncbi:MAG: lipopolysaccharide biosynthesis protein [bacterium]|nr:lipopolysaccharide biosynthesis protein [bacterium]